MMKNIFFVALLAISIAFASSCSSYLDVSPKDKIAQDDLSENDIEYVINGIYAEMEEYYHTFLYDWDVKGENYKAGPGFALVDPLLMTPSSSDILSMWQRCFTSLNKVNFMIETYEDSENKSSTTIQTAGGVGYFFRAFIYYNLATRWGVAPILRSRSSETVALSSEEDVWDFIVEDIEKAETLLPSYSDKFYLSTYGANALQARIYLAIGDTDKAIAAASAVIASGSFTLTSTSNDFASNFISTTSSRELVFTLANKRSSSEIVLYQKLNDIDATWEYSPADARYSSLFADPTYATGDIRAEATFGDDATRLLKYPNGSTGQYVTNSEPKQTPLNAFRLSEMYLIKAEAEGNNATGLATLESFLSNRYATVSLPASMSDEDFEDIILDERNREFLGEGFRWYDVKRTGRLDLFETLGDREYLMYYPIPQTEIDLAGSNNYPQNPGY